MIDELTGLSTEDVAELDKMLGIHEGDKQRVYLDSKGIPTIGKGHNMNFPLLQHIKAFLDANGYITEEMINDQLNADLEIAANSCRRVYPNFLVFPHHVRMALLDIMFNFGEHHWVTSFGQTITLINAEQWDQVEEHLQHSLWYSQVHQRAKDDCAEIEEGEKET